MTSAGAKTVRRFAPLVAGLAILGAMIHAPFRVKAHPGAGDYMDRVKLEAEQLPYMIGPWLGRDVEVPPAAVQLLRPNVLLQRQYTNMETQHTVSLLFVHCGDSRDMQGHYPPICYPAHGWTPQEAQDVAVEISGAAFPARRYTFARERERGRTEMTVVNFFVMPSGEIQVHRDISAVNRAAQSATAAGLGSAQIQLVTFDPRIDLLADGVASQLLEGLEPLLRTITAGVDDRDI